MSYFTLAHPDAVMPTRATQGSAGYDLTAVSLKRDRENNVIIYDTGITLSNMPFHYRGQLPLMLLCARSSIFKRGKFVLANGVGIIDSDYTDTIKLIYTPISDMVSIEDDQPFKIGEKVGQVVLVTGYFDPVEKTPTAKRKGGLGSTDKETNSES